MSCFTSCTHRRMFNHVYFGHVGDTILKIGSVMSFYTALNRAGPFFKKGRDLQDEAAADKDVQQETLSRKLQGQRPARPACAPEEVQIRRHLPAHRPTHAQARLHSHTPAEPAILAPECIRLLERSQPGRDGKPARRRVAAVHRPPHAL